MPRWLRNTLLALLLAFPLSGFAQEAPCGSSGIFTADGQITTGRVVVCGIAVVSDGANNATAILYDNTSAAAPALTPTLTVVSTDFVGYLPLPPGGVNADTGVYLDVTTSGTMEVVVYYRRQP